MKLQGANENGKMCNGSNAVPFDKKKELIIHYDGIQ
jgi:hypothetical protein